MKKYLIIFTIIFAGMFFALASEAQAANIFVGPTATGNGSGSDWNNMKTFPFGGTDAAWKTFWVRDNTYYIASGNYLGSWSPNYTGSTGMLLNLNESVDGVKYITLKKATENERGTDIGWQNSYGEGQAIFEGPDSAGSITNYLHVVNITTDYWKIDGVKKDDWNQGHGIKFVNKFRSHWGDRTPRILYISQGVDHLDLAYLELANGLPMETCAREGGIYGPNNSGNIKIRHCYLHDMTCGTMILDHPDANPLVIEHTLIARNNSNGSLDQCNLIYPGDPQCHGNGIRIWGSNNASQGEFGPSADNNLIRYNRFEDLEGSDMMALCWGNDNVRIYGNVFYYTAENPLNREGTSKTIEDFSNLTEIGSSNVSIYNNSFVNLDTGYRPHTQGKSFLDLGFGIDETDANKKNNIYLYNNLFFKAYGKSFSNTGFTDADYNQYSNIELVTSYGDTRSAEANSIISNNEPSPFANWQNQNFTLITETKVQGKDLSQESWWGPNDSLLDPNGNTRGADGRWDVGAYEFNAVQACAKGDFSSPCNNFELSDIQTMISIILGIDTTTSRTQADMTTPSDGVVDISDLQLLINKVLGIN